MRVARRIELSAEDRAVLETVLSVGGPLSRSGQRARIVLLAGEGKRDKEIAARLGITAEKAARWRARYLAGGAEALLADAPRPGKPPTISAPLLARIREITLRVQPPNGVHWTSRAMAAAANVSESSVRRIWKKLDLHPNPLAGPPPIDPGPPAFG